MNAGAGFADDVDVKLNGFEAASLVVFPPNTFPLMALEGALVLPNVVVEVPNVELFPNTAFDD